MLSFLMVFLNFLLAITCFFQFGNSFGNSITPNLKNFGGSGCIQSSKPNISYNSPNLIEIEFSDFRLERAPKLSLKSSRKFCNINLEFLLKNPKNSFRILDFKVEFQTTLTEGSILKAKMELSNPLLKTKKTYSQNLAKPGNKTEQSWIKTFPKNSGLCIKHKDLIGFKLSGRLLKSKLPSKGIVKKIFVKLNSKPCS